MMMTIKMTMTMKKMIKITINNQIKKSCKSNLALFLSAVANPDIPIRRGPGHPDPERREMPGLQKFFFRPLGPQFGLKIREGPGPSGPSIRSATEVSTEPLLCPLP